MFGDPYFGGQFFGEIAPQSSAHSYPDSECGAAFGTAVFGDPYFGGTRTCSAPTPPHTYPYPECGAAFGTLVFGESYFGELYTCGSTPVPPTPPTPVPEVVARAGGGGPPPGGRKTRQPLTPRIVPTERPKPAVDQWEAQKRSLVAKEIARINADDEDIAMVIGIWLNRRR